MRKQLLFLRTAALNLLFVGVLLFADAKVQAQTYYDMSTANYLETFTSWTTPTTGVNWSSVAVNTTGSIPSATRITVASATFTTGSAGGVQNGSTNIQFLSTGATDNSSSVALDLNLNFTGTTAGTLSYNVATVNNSTGDRNASLRVYYSLNGTSWTEITGTNLPYVATNNVAGSASVSVALPSALNNQPTVKLRFYNHNGTGGSSGSRPKISLDNVAVTATLASIPNLSVNGTTSLSFGNQGLTTQSASQSFNLSGVNLTGFPSVITINAPNTNFQVSNDNSTWGASTTIAYTSATLNATPVYARFTPQSAGAQSGNITMSGGGDTTTPTVSLSGTGVLSAPVTTAPSNIGQNQFDANWNSAPGATGYQLDVSTSATFGTAGVAINESFTSTTFPPSGWLQTDWARSTTAADYVTAPAGSIAGAANGSLTTSAIANPLSMTFYLGRSTNATPKTLTVEVSTTSQTSGFTTVATFDHNNVTGGTYTQYTVNLSAYASFSTVYIRFVKASSTTSPWRLDDIVVNFAVPSFVPGYNALPVTGTTHTVTGLSPYTNYYYRVRATAGAETSANSNVQAVLTLPETVTWNGTAWSNTAGPDFTKEASIQGVYNTVPNGEFTALKLTLDSGSLTVAEGTSITVINEMVNNLTAADFVIENNASLVQINDTDNTGGATVKRSSAALMRLDYTLWSSPVSGQTLLGFSPLTVPTRFYTYNPASDQYATVASPSTTTFAEGTGYLIRMPDNHPTTATTWEGTYVGTPHNGNYVLSVGNNTYNAVGNPYPSVIDADAFINDNGITEALYFWRKTNNAATTSYATYTLAGGVGTSSNSGDPLGLVPNGFIQTGQGFIVRSTSPAILFNNDMRVYNYDNQFLRANAAERHRIWLNLTNTDGLFSQTMIAYMEGASAGIDASIDGRYFNDSDNALTSIVENEEFAVQGRSLPFTASDIVPLGFKVEAPGTYSISLDHVDGLFGEGQQIYLRDNTTGTVHDFATGPYAFATEAGVFNSRFEVVYDSALAVDNPGAIRGVVAYKQNGALVINSGDSKMETVEIFDLSGRLLLKRDAVNASEVVLTPSISTQALLLHVKTVDGVNVTRKIMY